MSSVIPREHTQGFQRWELGSFDQPASPLGTNAPPLSGHSPDEATTPAVAEPVAPPLTLPTAEDIEQIHTQAHAEGFSQGQAEGFAQGHAEGLAAAQAEQAKVADMIAHFTSALNGLDQEMAEDVLDLAIELTRQMVGSSLQVRREGLLPIIREAMAALPMHHGTVTVHIHPDDSDYVRSHFGEQINHGGWRIFEEREIQPGGCRLTAGSSEVDGTVATRWRRVLEAIGAKPEWLEPSP